MLSLIFNKLGGINLFLIILNLVFLFFYFIAVLKPKGVVSFNDFNKKISFIDTYVEKITTTQIIFAITLIIINVINVVNSSDTLSLIKSSVLAFFSYFASKFTIKSIYFIFNSKNKIYYLYVSALLKSENNENSRVKKLINANSPDHKEIKNKLYIVLNYENYLPLIAEQIILLDEMYEGVPRKDKYNKKIADYVSNLNILLTGIIEEEKENKIIKEKLAEENFDKYLDDKLEVIIKSNRNFLKALKARRQV